jgi:hypothetical protein
MRDIPALFGSNEKQPCESLVDALCRDVFRCALWLFKNKSLAEELVQQKFCVHGGL